MTHRNVIGDEFYYKREHCHLTISLDIKKMSILSDNSQRQHNRNLSCAISSIKLHEFGRQLLCIELW